MKMPVLFTIDFESVNVYGDEWIAYAALVMDSASGAVLERLFRAVRRFGMDAPQRVFWTRHNAALTYLMRQVNPAASVVDLEIELAEFVRRLHEKYPTLQLVGDNPVFDFAILNGIMQRTGRLPANYRHGSGAYAFVRDVSSLPRPSADEVAALMRRNGMTDSVLPHTPVFDAMRVLMCCAGMKT